MFFCTNFCPACRLWKLRPVLEDGDIAPLRRDHLFKRIKSRAVEDRLFRQAAACIFAAFFDEAEHICRERQRFFPKVFRPLSFQDIYSLPNFNAVADAAAERRVHVRDESSGSASICLADFDHGLGKYDRVTQRLHKGTGADLDVEKNRTRARC